MKLTNALLERHSLSGKEVAEMLVRHHRTATRALPPCRIARPCTHHICALYLGVCAVLFRVPPVSSRGAMRPFFAAFDRCFDDRCNFCRGQS